MADSSAAQLARRAGAKLRICGHAAYLVGGCVRDLLLGREPADYDLATDAPPERVLALFPGAQLVGAHFGVVLVREADAQVEVATFRSDHSYLDGRHPGEVRFETDPRQDVQRRDFTINAVLMDPQSGEVLDFVGGRADLEAGLVRAIGDPEARFAEDHLRMLRAIRFAARFGFHIEPATFTAIRRQCERIRGISAERIRDELVMILTEGGAVRGLDLLDESGLLEVLLPEVAAMKGVPQPPEFHPEGDVWTHVRLMLGEMRNPTPTLALGVLLHDVGKPRTFVVRERIRFDGHVEIGTQLAVQILTRLRFSNDDIRHVAALAAHHLRFKDVTRMRTSTLKRFLRMDRFEEHLELHRLDCISSHRLLDHYNFARSKLAEFSTEQLKPKPLLTGHDLIAAGYQPGPAFARILKAVEDAQLESEITTPEQALQLVLRLFEPPEGKRYVEPIPPGP
jgi:poly(A) polymerase